MKYLFLMLAFSFNCWIFALFGINVMQLLEGDDVNAFYVLFFIICLLLYGYILQFWNKWFYNSWKHQQTETKFLYNLIVICGISLFFILYTFMRNTFFISFDTKINTIYSIFIIAYVFFDLLTPAICFLIIKIDESSNNYLKKVRKEININKKILPAKEVSINNYLYVYKFPYNCLILDISKRLEKEPKNEYLCAIINIPLVAEKIDNLSHLIVLNKFNLLKIYQFDKENKTFEINKENFSEIKEHFNLQDSILLKNAIGNYILNVKPVSDEEFCKFKKIIKKLKHPKELFIFYNF